MKSRTQSEFPKKWVGVVDVKTGKDFAKLTSTGTDKQGKVKPFPNGESSIKIALSDFSKEAKRVIKPGMDEPKKFRVRLNEDADGVETVTPVSGVFPAVFVGIAPKKNEVPVPYAKTYNLGQKDENTHLEFIAQYEITEGKYAGMELPGYYLHYKFEESEEEDGMTQFDTADTPQASKLHMLQKWAELTGNILDAPIEWIPDPTADNKLVEAYAEKHKCEYANILPTLQDRGLEAARPVNLVFEDGYIKSVVERETDDDEQDETEDDFDEKFPVKEPVKEKDIVQDTLKGKAKATKKVAKKSSDEDDDL